MQDKISKRKLGPDLLKIAATICVIIIHHKYFGDDPLFVTQFAVLYSIFFAVSLLVGAYLCRKSYTKGEPKSKCIRMFLIPVACFGALWLLRKFAVAIFMLVTGYLLTASIKKWETPLKTWYTSKNIVSRVMRFYLPFVPVFVVGLVYKIIVKDYDYTAMEVMARFILGGFKPGSYYITILAEMVFVFPLIYILVKRLKSAGVFIAVLINLAYDAACTYFGMNDILYKFLIFRFTAHIALGIYGNLLDFKQDKKFNALVFAVGFVYVMACIYLKFCKPRMFFQWEEAAFPVALFMYVPVVWFINATHNLSYTDSPISKFTLVFANATYHIFLIQLLYYTTFGFEFNEFVYNVAVTIPLNLAITVPLGIWYYKLVNPLEKKFTDRVTKKLKK